MAVLVTESPKAQAAYVSLRKRVFSTGVGVPFPPVSEISRELGVSQHTINKAYAQLEVEGLIERKRRKGVFVADRTATGEMAIVLKPQLLGAEASQSYRIICAALTEILHTLNPSWNVKLHLGKAVIEGRAFSKTLDILEPTVLPRLRGIFSFHSLYDQEPFLEKNGVPIVHVDDINGKYHVSFDRKDFFRQAINCLIDTGCRTAGLLYTEYSCKKREDMHKHEKKSDYFSELADTYGLQYRPEWMICRKHSTSENITENDGYNLFMRLWKQPEKPDGLIVVDDVLCKGVLRAVLQLGLSLPEDIRLITYANKGVPLPFHKPVTRVEFDLVEEARIAVDMMKTLIHGENMDEKSILLSGKLIRGNTM